MSVLCDRNISYSVRYRCRSILWLQKYLLQRSEALQERPVAPEALFTAFASVAGAFCGSGSISHSIREHYKACSVAVEASITAFGSVSGSFPWFGKHQLLGSGA